MKRRSFFLAATAQLGLFAQPFVAHAQAFPSRPVRVVVAWPAGGFVDAVTRALTDKLAESWSQPVLVENRTGAYGLVGTEQAMRSPADGYAWLIGTLGTPMSASLYRRKWSAADELSGVAMIASSPLIAVVPASLPVNNVREFVTLARSQPGKLNYLNPSLGSASHLNTELLKLKEKLDIISVAYNGQPPGVVDLLAGQTHFGLLAPQVAAGHVKTGRLKALAVAFPTRIKEFPDVPTFAEAGHPELNVVASYSVLVPKGTPRETVSRISADIQKALADPEVRRRIEAAGAAVAGPSSPEQVDAFLKAETARWNAFFRDNKVSLDDATLR